MDLAVLSHAGMCVGIAKHTEGWFIHILTESYELKCDAFIHHTFFQRILSFFSLAVFSSQLAMTGILYISNAHLLFVYKYRSF